MFERTKPDNSAERPGDLRTHTRACKNAVLSQRQTVIKNGRQVYEGFMHPIPAEHSWQNAAGRSRVGGGSDWDTLHSGYGRVCGSSHRAHPDIRSTCRGMFHWTPLWVHIRGTEAIESIETGKLVMGTCLNLVMASCAAFTCAPELFHVQNGTAATQRPRSSCSLKCTPTHPLPPTKAGRTD